MRLNKKEQDLQFKAVLAKNQIARSIKSSLTGRGYISEDSILSCLKDIEKFIGELNQPSVNDIYHSDMDI